MRCHVSVSVSAAASVSSVSVGCSTVACMTCSMRVVSVSASVSGVSASGVPVAVSASVSEHIAYRMESMLFTCPFCYAHESMHSERDTVSCKVCGGGFRYTEYGMLEGLPYKTVEELYKWQRTEVARVADKGEGYSVEAAKVPSWALMAFSGSKKVLISMVFPPFIYR